MYHNISVDLKHSGKAFIGKDDWLFLLDDSNGVREQMTGNKGFDLSTLAHWVEQTTMREEVCSKYGATYLLLIAPEKEVLYPSKLPKSMQPVEARPVNQLLDQLDKLVKTCYPVDSMKKALEYKQVYSKTDTHWNDFGALAVVNTLLSVIGDLSLVEYGFDFVDSSRRGDLGKEFEPPKIGNFLELKNKLHPLWTNSISFTGRIAYYVNGAGDGKCLVFGNSCISDAFVTYLLQPFDSVLFVFSDNVDYELIAREKPRVVLHQTCERFVLRSPSDRNKLSGRERGAIKHFIASINGNLTSNNLSDIAFAAKQGSVDCIGLYACLLKYSGNHDKAAGLMDSIGKPQDTTFIWSIACALSGDIDASLVALDQAVSLYPDREFLRKFMGFMLTNKQYDIARLISRELNCI